MRSLFVFAIFILFTFPLILSANAQSPELYYVLIQITLRDSNGTLIAYLQTDNVTEVNVPLLNQMLDNMYSSDQDSLIKVDDQYMQIISRTTEIRTDESNLLASVQLVNRSEDGVETAIRFSHDGIRLEPDERVSVIWTFVRLV